MLERGLRNQGDPMAEEELQRGKERLIDPPLDFVTRFADPAVVFTKPSLSIFQKAQRLSHWVETLTR